MADFPVRIKQTMSATTPMDGLPGAMSPDIGDQILNINGYQIDATQLILTNNPDVQALIAMIPTEDQINGYFNDSPVTTQLFASIDDFNTLLANTQDDVVSAVAAANNALSVGEIAVAATENITTTQISDGAITTPLLATAAVVAAKIAAGSITASAIAVGAIQAGAIAAGAVEAGTIAAGAIDGFTITGAFLAGTTAIGSTGVIESIGSISSLTIQGANIYFYAPSYWPTAGYISVGSTVLGDVGLLMFPPYNAGGTTPHGTMSLSWNGIAMNDTYFIGAPTTGSSANAFLDSSNGNHLLRQTSASKYKTDIRPLTDDDVSKIWSLEPMSYIDKADQERGNDTRYLGFTAENVHEAGLSELVQYVNDEPDNINYDRLPVLHHMVLKDLVSRIEALEAKNAA